MHTNMLSW